MSDNYADLENMLEVTVTDCEKQDGTIWVFGGITNDDESRNVMFGVDARIGMPLFDALSSGQGPVAFVQQWQILSARPSTTSEADALTLRKKEMGARLAAASDRTHQTIANYAIAKYEHEQNVKAGALNPMGTAQHYRAAEQEMHRAIQAEVDLTIKAHQIGML